MIRANVEDMSTVSDSKPPRPLASAIACAIDALFSTQHSAGYWWAELQSNVSITAEVVLLHYIWGCLARKPRADAERYFRSEQRDFTAFRRWLMSPHSTASIA